MNCSRTKTGNMYTEKKLPNSGPYIGQVETVCQDDNTFTKSNSEFISSQPPEDLEAVKKSLEEDVSFLGWGTNLVKSIFGTSHLNKIQQQHSKETIPLIEEIPVPVETHVSEESSNMVLQNPVNVKQDGGSRPIKRKRQSRILNSRRKSSRVKPSRSRKHSNIKYVKKSKSVRKK